jgi:hypothetical protein
MVELTVVLKSKDMSGNNYTFVTLMEGGDPAEVERDIFNRPKDSFLPLRSNNAGSIFASMSDVSFISIKPVELNQTMGQAVQPAPPSEDEKINVSDIVS